MGSAINFVEIKCWLGAAHRVEAWCSSFYMKIVYVLVMIIYI